ncbi:MAG: DUF1501 domain-containing protein [Pseudomonadota bacterium]
MMAAPLSRREFLARTGFVGCSLAASPLVTPISFAAAPWDTRLVVIILRGGMDGLDAVQPYGDSAFAQMRGPLALGPEGGAYDLDGYFALHPALAPLLRMWQAGQLGFVHAVSTPYRGKRSHFDGQDLLEAGTPDLAGVRDGWLNRMLQVLPQASGQAAYAVGRNTMRVLQGAADVANWAPDAKLSLSPQTLTLLELVTEADPALHAALSEARILSQIEQAKRKDGQRTSAHVDIASFAAQRLSEETRIAAFSLNGWDTHRAQPQSIGRALTQLSETLLTLQGTMAGGVWAKTAVIAMTEFGRTVRQNGAGGTDHGTGGLMIAAGGAIKGGRVFGNWPGLGQGDLYEDRDLMPTRDVRAYAAWVMRALTGLDRHKLENAVFPGLDMGRDPGLIL